VRLQNLQKFRNGESSSVLVCTDLAARGLDVPAVDHVVMFDFPLNALDYLHRSGRTARGSLVGVKSRVTALVTKRDKVLANAIQQAVRNGEPLDGLSSRKTDYLPGGRLDGTSSSSLQNKRRAKSSRSSRGASSSSRSRTSQRRGSLLLPKRKPRDTTARKRTR